MLNFSDPVAQLIAFAPRTLSEGVQLRLLENSDAAALREFEIANRVWFERFIATRGNFFYLPDGIQAHIQHCLQEFAAGRMQPMVLASASGEILGRANLHQIDFEEAKIGYRLAEHVAGRGLAYASARLLVDDAQKVWHLPQVRSFVVPSNYPSAHILQKLGFQHLGKAHKPTKLNSGDVLCDAYLLRFA
jgi:ribosomal-protein-alanine N-acetyltransferase